MCSDLIRVHVEGVERVANLEDISPSGACLLFEQPIAEGSRISLQLGPTVFTGEVRYAIHNQIGYFAGVRFDTGQKWSRKIYRPKHLLDPTRLLKRCKP